MEKMTLTKAIKTHIGMLPGQKLVEFAAELKLLTEDDREWFKVRFAEEFGIEIVPAV